MNATAPRKPSPIDRDDAEAPAVGVAEVREPEPKPAREAESAGGGHEPPAAPPPVDRGRHRWRPDPPPRWWRIVLYGMMLIACFVLGSLIGRATARIDRAVWGPSEWEVY
jgi:hypothetical protein